MSVRKGAVGITIPAIPDPLIMTRALLQQLLQVVAQIGAGEVGDAEVSDVSIAKLIAGTLTGDKVMQFDGAGVILKSANFIREAKRFTDGTFNPLGRTLSSIGADFTPADVGRSITSDVLQNGTTIESVTDESHAVLSLAPIILAINQPFVITGRPTGAGWALYGDGTMEVNLGGIFRGKLELAGFAVEADGTVAIGSGPSKMRALPDGSFTWGSGGAIVGITPAGELFAGGLDAASAIFFVSKAGDVTVKETAQSMHSIPIGALNTLILPPVFDPPGGAFTTAVDVGMASQTANVKIYYTDDGTDPTDASTLYTGARVHLTATKTLKSIAYIGPFKSAISTQIFTLDAAVVPNPQSNPVGGSYSPVGGDLAVELSDLLAGSSIRYTTDGVTVPSDTVGTLISPPNGATVPSATIHLLTGTRVLKMIGFKAGKTNSAVVTQTYVITTGGGGSGGGGGGGRGNVP